MEMEFGSGSWIMPGIGDYTSAMFSWETTFRLFFYFRKRVISCLSAEGLSLPAQLVLSWISNTHSWHSVEIFSSLVLPRKILTRAPKFPVLGLFSTWKKEEKTTALHKLQNYQSVECQQQEVCWRLVLNSLGQLIPSSNKINKIHRPTKIFIL